MSYELSQEELDATAALEPQARLSYFVSKALETDTLWTLAAEKDLLVLGAEGHDDFVVLFPHPDFAVRWFDSCGLEEADLVGMETASWVESTLDELKESKVEVGVFPTEEDGPVFLAPDELLKMLQPTE